MKYLIEMTPVSSYAFSGESSFLNPGEAKTRRSGYHVDSEYLPPQTTVLGTLRRCMLEWKGLLREDRQYTQSEKESMTQLIGEMPFRIGSPAFNLGAVRGISCLFLTRRTTDEQEQWLFHIPRNADQNEDAEAYHAMPWNRAKMQNNEIALEGYSVKKPQASAYVAVSHSRRDALPAGGVEAVFTAGLHTGSLIPQSNIFTVYQQSAVRKVEDDDQKAYRLHERVVFNRNEGRYAFAVVAELAPDTLPDDPRPLIVPMGARGSLFSVQATPLRQEEADSSPAFPQKECCIAALSPLALPADWRQKVAFAILNKQKIRQMVPVEAGSYTYRHDTTLRFFAAPGSVLYLAAEDAPAFVAELQQNNALYKAGFNHVIIMDGEELV